MNILNNIYNMLFHRSMYIIADPRDNSITLSRRLVRRMGVMKAEQAKVFVFKTNDKYQRYAFTLNPQLPEPTQLCAIQYNTKHRCIGFETLCPTVNKIFYDYRLPLAKAVKLSVRSRTLRHITYYVIIPPCHEKSIGKQSKA